MTDKRTILKTHLQSFQPLELRPAALALLNALGYASDKTMELDGSPAAVLLFHENPEQFIPGAYVKIGFPSH